MSFPKKQVIFSSSKDRKNSFSPKAFFGPCLSANCYSNVEKKVFFKLIIKHRLLLIKVFFSENILTKNTFPNSKHILKVSPNKL